MYDIKNMYVYEFLSELFYFSQDTSTQQNLHKNAHELLSNPNVDFESSTSL